MPFVPARNSHFKSASSCPETWFSCVQEKMTLAVSHQLTSFGLSYKQKSFTLARLFMLQSENPATRVLFHWQQRQSRVKEVNFSGLHPKTKTRLTAASPPGVLVPLRSSRFPYYRFCVDNKETPWSSLIKGTKRRGSGSMTLSVSV